MADPTATPYDTTMFPRAYVDSAVLDDMTSMQFNQWAYALPESQTGCYNPGSLPIALANNDTCLLGFYCPNSNNEHPPQMCPPTWQCAVLRANQGTCPYPQGALEPLICPGGSYCPAGGKTRIPCDAGTFCPQGSFEPIKCDTGAYCPWASAHQIPLLPLYVVVAIDFVLLCVLIAGLAYSKWRKRRKPKYSSIDMQVTEDDREALRGLNMSPRYSVSIAEVSPPTTVPASPALLSPHTRARSTSNASETTDVDNCPQDFAMQKFLIYLSRAIHTKELGLSFDFEGLSFKTRQNLEILHNITGSIPRGTMTGIMGGSGAGKSTLVNALMRGKSSAGTLKINGVIKDMKKLPSSWNDRAIQDYVDSLIACLSLTHVQNSLVGDARKPVISGGQRKRVSVGIELAAAPMVMFLDEPTSGLDATSAASIMLLLKAISRLGVTVIAIVHQPREDIFVAFDQLLLLAKGSQVYAGATEDVVPYFEDLGYQFPLRSNPADIIMDVITGNGKQYSSESEKFGSDTDLLIKFWYERGQFGKTNKILSVAVGAPRNPRLSLSSMQSTLEHDQSLHETMKTRGASWYAQVYYCTKRALLQQVRNRTSLFFEIFVATLAGLVIGLSAYSSKGSLFSGIYHPPFTQLSSAVDYKSAPQLGLLSAMAIGLASSAPGVWVFGEEVLMFQRESSSGHSKSAYYIGKVLSTLPRIILAALHYTVMIGVLATPLIGFQDMYAANLLYFYAIYGLSSVVSMLVKREDGPLLAVLLSLVLGVKEWHMEWFWRLSPGVWFTEAYWTKMVSPMAYLWDVELATQTIGFSLGEFGKDLALIFVISTIYRLLAYALLILFRKRRR
ncbi:unnamed protein product [Aureobasidium mustum]|uniref:ABC transporter domain-containing protein n=1 Tax=Aureobasidium mustum TaxID=2773714 RepID=A0A9N8JZA5_9PEZI|nr:unnamed protein product [Aureobasidium mustum]